MDNADIVGGVSPLKQRQKTRGGKSAKRATATSKRRGGFQEAKGEWGGGGRNVGGYNVQTSFTPGPAWVKPANAGSGTTIKPKPTISQTILDNELITGEGVEYKTDPDVTTEKKRQYVGEKRDACSAWYIAKHGDAKCKEYKEFRKKNPRKPEYKTEAGQKYKQTYKTKDGVRVPGSESGWKKV